MTSSSNLNRTLISTLAAVTLGGAVMSAAAPAQALTLKGSYGNGGLIAAGFLGGMALGAMTVGTVYPAHAGVGPVILAPRCYVVREPVTNVLGILLYYRNVRVCG